MPAASAEPAAVHHILHLDMDAFYASVEQRDDPSLRGKPVIVGGHPTRGVVLAASYEVRPFGVRSAMPMAMARRLAPAAIVVPPRMDAYAEASAEVFAIFASVTPLIEPLSLDEAFLDVSASRALFGRPGEIARAIRARIAHELGLPASAGIAAVKFVAKIASDLAKPNGQLEVPAVDTLSFLAPLPVARLWGVGPKLQARLNTMGLCTVGDLARRERAELVTRLGAAGGDLWDLARGIDPRHVVPDRAAKSIGAEDTFEADLDPAALPPHVHAQALRVGRRLRATERRARVVQLKLKTAKFRLITRQVTLEEPTDDGQAIYRAAQGLLLREAPAELFRLCGVSAQDLTSPGGPAQLGLFAKTARPPERLNQALDRIHDRFGDGVVTTGDQIASGPRALRKTPRAR